MGKGEIQLNLEGVNNNLIPPSYPSPREFIGHSVSVVVETIQGLIKLVKDILASIPPLFSTNPYAIYHFVSVLTEKRTDLGGGIVNQGNTCYIASLVQALHPFQKFLEEELEDTPKKQLKDQIIALQQQKELGTEERKEREKSIKKFVKTKLYSPHSSKPLDTSKEIKKIECEVKLKNKLFTIFETISQNQTVKEIGEFRETLRKCRNFSQYSQEDSHELCVALFELLDIQPFQLLNNVHYELPKEVERKEWYNDHTIALKDTIRVVDIPLQLEKMANLQEIFTHSIQSENREVLRHLPGEERCRELPIGTITKETVKFNKEAPPFLPIQLQRFLRRENESLRIGIKVEPAETLSLEIVKSDGESELVKYELMASVVHHGSSLYGGHYIAYVKKELEGGTSRWIQYNDDSVGLCKKSEEAIKDMAYNGYLFFYKRIERVS